MRYQQEKDGVDGQPKAKCSWGELSLENNNYK